MDVLTQQDVTQAFNEIYQSVGSDLQAARHECGEHGAMSRQEIIEVCCDHIYSYMDWTTEQLKEWEALDYDAKMRMARVALPYETYE